MRSEPRRPRGVVGAVPELAASAVESAREVDARLVRRSGGEERLGRLAWPSCDDFGALRYELPVSCCPVGQLLWPHAQRQASRFAICSGVSPSTSVCSSATFVSRTTSAPTTFVASRRPPSPASTTATSMPCSANSTSAAAVSASNCVAPSASASGRMRPTASSKSASAPSDPDAFGPAAHVGRGVGARPPPVGLQQSGDRPRRGRLAVRPDNMNRRIPSLGMPEAIEQALHAVEPELLRPGAQRGDPRRRGAGPSR